MEESAPEREDEKKVWRRICVNQKVWTIILILEEMRSKGGGKGLGQFKLFAHGFPDGGDGVGGGVGGRGEDEKEE